MRTTLKLLFIFCLFLATATAEASTFVVTSNADSGPGTLRDALTKAAANGSSVKDYINFNLVGTLPAARTITLLSELPAVSSNLVIDGTTQPGGPLGLGDAKIIITAAPTYAITNSSSVWCGLTLVNVQDIEIYGFSITDFYPTHLQKPLSTAGIFAGIWIASCDRITIGKAGKGNLFSGNIHDIYASAVNDIRNSKLSIQSNFFGYTPAGTPTGDAPMDNVALNGTDIHIGGIDLQNANTFSGPFVVSGDNITVEGNNRYFDTDGYPDFQVGLSIYGGSNITVKNNILGLMGVQGTNTFNISGNKSYPDLSMIFITIANSQNGIIGGNDLLSMNTINSYRTGYSNAITSENSTNIQVLKNRIRCSDKAFHIKDGTSIPDIEVLINSPTEFSGTASANALINVYIDNTGCTICNPVEFYTQVMADATGKWKVTGNFTGKALLANATLLQNSSEFTIPYQDPNSAIITKPSCGLSNGSISLGDVKHVVTIEWYDQINSQKIGEGKEIKNLGPGVYYAVLSNGGCQLRSTSFLLQNVVPRISATEIKITNASCGASNGLITGLSLTDFQAPVLYNWKDEHGAMVGNTLDISGLAAGRYTFSVSSNGCTETYGPIAVSDIPAPVINLSTVEVKPSSCARANGSIKNIQVSGTGTLTFQWKRLNGQPVVAATSKDLVNAEAGWYFLEVKDQSNCPATRSAALEITDEESILMDEENVKVKGSGCNGREGAITGIQISGATRFDWICECGRIINTSSADLLNASPGKYHLKAYNSLCSLASKTYEILPPPTIEDALVLVTQPSCHLPNGSVKGLVTKNFSGNIKVEWKNSEGTVISNEVDLKNVAPGQYTLSVSGDDNCMRTYGPISLNNTKGASVDISGAVVAEATCGKANGSIKHIIAQGTGNLSYQWKTENGQPVSGGTSLDLLNAKAGRYLLEVKDATNCAPSISATIEIRDRGSITIDETQVRIKPTGCNNASGAITGLRVLGADKFDWIAESGDMISTPSPELVDAPPGKYRLKAYNLDCSSVSGTYEIFASAIEDRSLLVKQPSCFLENGSITGLLLTNFSTNISIEWKNKTGEVVSSDIDLKNVGAGAYTLFITDTNNCTRTYGPVELSNVGGAFIDVSTAKVIPASCGSANGSISNVSIKGSGNLSYQWKTEDGRIVLGATSPDLLNTKPGEYFLEVKDASSCPPSISEIVEIPDQGGISMDETHAIIEPVACQSSLGGVIGIHVSGADKFQWISDDGTVTTTSSADLLTAVPGNYRLKASNAFCNILTGVYEIPATLTLNKADLALINDACDSKKGSITGLQASGGKAPYTYTWSNNEGSVIKTSTSSSDLTGLQQGKYNLMLKDGIGSCPINESFTITNTSLPQNPPSVSNTEICAPGNAVIMVDNPQQGKYRLYESLSERRLIGESEKGIFNVRVDNSATFYVTFVSQSCESELVPVTVRITNDIKIPNTITPNGDGINDVWTISNLESYPEIRVRIFDRYGNSIFDSTGYRTPFDGRRNGLELPGGSYYYLLDFKKGCKLITGNLTILR